MFVKPHPERTVTVHLHGTPDPVKAPLDVVHPHTRLPMAREGMEVPEDIYWMRRLRDGDVVKADPPASAPEAATDHANAPALPPPASEQPIDHTEAEHGA